MKLVRIGLTGGIAAGKSTIAAHLRTRGMYVIDYDQLAHEVTEPSSPLMQEIVREFGSDALDVQGGLNRAWMAQHVFADDLEAVRARKRLESLIHPAVYECAQSLEQVYMQYAQAERLRSPLQLCVVHDVPLLAHVISKIPFVFDHIITVEAPVEVRIERMVVNRGFTKEQAKARIANQVSQAQRLAIADGVIDATRTIEQMFEDVDILIASWL